MKPYYIILLSLLLQACQSHTSNTKQSSNPFAQELDSLQSYFAIPGMAALVAQDDEVLFESYSGWSDITSQIKVDSLTAFPIASLTKVYAATLVFQLVEKDLLDLNTPVIQILPDLSLDPNIKVKHLLSHTSQGPIGEQFFYSTRYSLLTQIIEKINGTSFAEAMQQGILKPGNLQQSFLLDNETQLSNRNHALAQPYFYNNKIEEGFIDYGYSSSAGMVTTARDLLKMDHLLNSNALISETSKQFMYQPAYNNAPYGHGIFTYNSLGTPIVWAYGQYDCYSSLWIKVPSKGLSLILLANNNLMSDPARLIMGDLESSLFALSFLKNYVHDLQDMPLFESPDKLYSTSYKYPEFYRKKVLAQALAASFMARYNTEQFHEAETLIQNTFNQYPNYKTYGSINLLHSLSFLKAVSFYKDLGPYHKFDTTIESLGNHLLKQCPYNPYLHTYMGDYFDRNDQLDKARLHFKTVSKLPNFSRHWYTKEAENWLSSHSN